MRWVPGLMSGLCIAIFILSITTHTWGEDTPLLSLGGGVVQAAQFSPDGRYIAVATTRGVEIRDGQTFKEITLLSGGSAFIAFSPDGKQLVAASPIAPVARPGKIWDMTTFKEIAELPAPVGVSAFSPDGQFLATTQWWPGKVKLWDAATWTEVKTFTINQNNASVNAVTFSPDGRVVCAGLGWTLGPDKDFGAVILWDIASGKTLHTISPITDQIRSVAFHPNGHLLIATTHRSALLWETETWQGIGGVNGRAGFPASVVFDSKTGHLAIPWDNYKVNLWDVSAQERLQTFAGHQAHIRSISFHPNRQIVATSSWDGSVRLWNVGSGEAVDTLEYSAPIIALSFTPDSGGLRLCTDSRTAKTWDLTTATRKTNLDAKQGTYRSVAFHPKDAILAVIARRTIELWNLQLGQLKANMEIPGRARPKFITYSHDGHWLAAVSSRGVDIWDMRVATVLHQFRVHGGIRATFSSDDRILAVATWSDIQLWDVLKGEKISELPKEWGHVQAMTFSPDNQWLAADDLLVRAGVGAIGAIRIWHVPTQREHLVFEGSTFALAYSPDGAILASGRSNGEINLWDAQTGEMIRTFQEHTLPVTNLVFSHDGRHLASGGEDGIIFIWDINPSTTPSVSVEPTDRLLTPWGKIKQFNLLQNFPNPFNPETWIPYQLAIDAEVSLHIYDSRGQLIHTLHMGRQRATSYVTSADAAYWDGRNQVGERVPSGMYFYRMQVGNASATRRMVIQK